MKKLFRFSQLVFGLSLLLSIQATAQCSYTLTLLDSYGDGWNGNSIDVMVGGTTSTYSFSSGSVATFSITAAAGDSLSFEWQGGGNYQDECTFNIANTTTGGALYSSPAGNLLSTSVPQYTVTCSSSNQSTCLYSSPYFEEFSGAGSGWITPTNQSNIGSLNSCWNRDSYTNYNWIKAPSPSGFASFTGPSGDHTNGGQGYLVCDPYQFGTGSSSSSLITPYVDLANDSAPQVSFWYHMFGSDIERLEIAITTDTAGSWTVLDSLLPLAGTFVSPNSPWQQAVYSISNYINDTVAFKFTAFRNTTSSGFGSYSRVGLDDLSVTEDTSSCSSPLNLQLVSLGISTAQVTWDTTGASNYQVQWAQGTTAVSGNTTIVSNNSYNLSGLASNSTYTLRVRAICGTNDTSGWSTNLTVTTSCGAFLAPWVEDFEGSDWVAPLSWYSQGTFGDCFIDSESTGFYWKVAQSPKNQNEGPSTDHTPTGGGKFLATNYRFGFAAPAIAPANLSFTSPWVALDSLTNPELRFWLHAFTTNGITQPFGRLTATIEKLNGQSTRVFDTTGALQANQTGLWKEVIVPLSNASSDTIRVTIGYKAVGLYSGQPFSVDDLSITEAPACPQPRYLKTLSVTTTSATIKWSTGGATNHQVRYKKVNTTAWNVISASTTQAFLAGLDPNTEYRWEIRDSCSSTEKSVWVRGPNFYTSCTIYTAPYSNNFSNNQWQGPSNVNPSGEIGNCFSRFEDSNDPYFWTGARSGFDHYFQTGPLNDHTGGSSGYFFSRITSTGIDTAKIELPAVYLGQVQIPEFSFWYHMKGPGIGGLNVYIRKLGGSDTLIANFNGQQQANSQAAWLKKTCAINAFQGDTVIVSFQAFKGIVSSSFFSFATAICIDDISFDGTSTCPAPTMLSATNVSTNSATLTWQGTSTQSILEYGPAGFTIGNGQIVDPVSSPYNLTGLLPNTTYTVFVKDSCTANLVSSNTTINFTTTPCPAVTAQGNISLSGTTVTAINTASTNDSILWVWGDGNSSIGDSATYTYSTPGVYQAQQIAYNYCGNADTTTTTLTVCSTVTSVFNVSGLGLVKNFGAGASIGAALSYSWSFGDGSTANIVSPSHTYAIPGNYTVTLVVTDACGTSNTSSQTISVCPLITPIFSSTITGTSSFNFLAQPSGLAAYSWDFGDGNNGNGINVAHSYSSIGTFAVTLTCTDTCGSQYTFIDTVSTCPALNANFSFNIISSGASGMLVSFFATTTGTSGLIWEWGDGTQTVTQAASISHLYPTVNLNYSITLKAYNECGDTITVVKSLNEVGLNESLLDGSSIYPNPNTSGKLTIDFRSPQEGQFLLYDHAGRMVQKNYFSKTGSLDIDVSNLSAGSYLLHIENQEDLLRTLIIKL